jgi:hypothetical protein
MSATSTERLFLNPASVKDLPGPNLAAGTRNRNIGVHFCNSAVRPRFDAEIYQRVAKLLHVNEIRYYYSPIITAVMISTQDIASAVQTLGMPSSEAHWSDSGELALELTWNSDFDR